MRISLRNISQLLCMTILCAVATSTVAGEEAGTLARVVERETTNKMLRLKIRIANGIYTPSRDAGYAGIGRLVDTEVYEDGSVKYYVRRGTSGGTGMLTLPGKYTDDASLTYSRAPGELIAILAVKYEPDRIELSLSPKDADEKSYGRIKLMTGKDYKNWPAARVLTFLDKAVVIPSIEDRPMWVQKYKMLISSLPRLEAAAAQGDAESRLAANDELRTGYNDLAVLKQNLAAIGEEAVVGDTQDYTALAQRIAAARPSLAAEVARIQTQKAEVAKQVRIQSLQTQRDKEKSEIVQTLNVVEKQKRKTVVGSSQREADMATLKNELKTLGQTDEALQREGSDITSSRAFAQTVQAKIDEMQREIDTAKVSAAAHGLDVKYQAMTARRGQLTNSFATAFGTPAADGIKNDLRQLLNQMLVNREEAAAQGSGLAKMQCTELREALQRLH